MISIYYKHGMLQNNIVSVLYFKNNTDNMHIFSVFQIAKMTRRSIRGSWKWFKRGVMGYAGGLTTANIFMFIYSKQ